MWNINHLNIACPSKSMYITLPYWQEHEQLYIYDDADETADEDHTDDDLDDVVIWI